MAIKRNTDMVAPTYLQKLVDCVGGQQAARRVGVTPGTVRNNLDNALTRRSVELAARYIFEREHQRQREAEQVLVVRLPASADSGAILSVLRMAGAKVVSLGGPDE